ncbi:MAG: SurA N-terminal domain-containing protein [Kiritimatiellia bacterium]
MVEQKGAHMAIRVNGELVSSRAVVQELTRLVKFYRDHFPEEELEENRDILIRKAKDQAIGARLLLEEARKAGVRVTDGEIAARRSAVAAEAGGEEVLTDLLDSQGMDEVWFRQSLADSLMIDKFVQMLIGGLEPPGEADVAKFLEDLKAKGRTATPAQALDLLVHERRGRVLTECVALLRRKAVVEDDEELDGADIDAIFDSSLMESENLDETDAE